MSKNKNNKHAAPIGIQASEEKQPEIPIQAPVDDARKTSFPVVGIGASAGGLEAFEKFFFQMPPDSGMAFVLVQHLSSPHKSILNDLVQRLTRMKVYQVTDGIDVQPNCAYIIPPNKDMALLHGKLHLLVPEAPRGLRLPIDYFFRSLAQDQHERAICIVLSGTGTDGTLGLKAIKGEGGMVMVQEPQSAKYDGMPRSAIGTGLADFALSPEKMPEQLMNYVEHAFGSKRKKIVIPIPKAPNSLEKIFILLRAQTGHDFSYYKQNTIRRRIERRMAVNQIEQLDNYLRFIQQNPLEVDMLFRDLLIGVTNFFRDPEAFESLQTQVIPQLMENKPAGQPVRVWVPGCSTGEEAYSIAILLREQMDALKRDFKTQIFATDIDSEAIDKARAGIYPDGIVADISPERLGRFFFLEGNAYQIKKSIRDMVVFAEQSVIEDPPFSKMDMISCRNLLIYLQPELQKRVIPLFHYSLQPHGFLFLGNSESVGEFADLFAITDRKWKLFQRKEDTIAHRSLTDFPRPLFMDDIVTTRAEERLRVEKKMSMRELAEKELLLHYTPACAIVNKKADVLYIHGRTGKYLEPAPGEASLNILRMAREGVRLELTTAIRKVIAQKTAIHFKGLNVKTNGERQIINLTVRPILEPPSMQGLIIVIFEEVSAESHEETVETTNGPITVKPDKIAERVTELERELRAKEEYLQTAIEELETSNEELKSTNEELQSTNEELQSTNEELETSKEELQSVNEELVTVNTEHQKKIEELSQANNDMSNLLAGTGVGTIFLDHQLCVQRFTPTATQIINLIQNDIGRPIGHIASNLIGYDRLVEDLQQVLSTLIPIEIQVQTTEEQWYLMRIHPYRTIENVIEGAVITYTEYTELKQVQQALQKSEEKYRSLIENSPDYITIVDRNGTIQFLNRAAPDINKEAVIGKSTIYDFQPPSSQDKLRELLAKVFQTGEANILQAIGTGPHESIAWYETRIAPIKIDEQVVSVMLISKDISELKQIEQRIQESNKNFDAHTNAIPEAACLHEVIYDESGKAVDYRVLDFNPSFEAIFHIPREQAVGNLASDLYEIDEPIYLEVYAKVATTQEPTSFEAYYPSIDKYFSISVYSTSPGKFATIFFDITKYKVAEGVLEQMEDADN